MRRKDLETARKPSISVYSVEDNIEFPVNVGEVAHGNTRKRSTYRVAPSDCEVEERCELIKSTYDVISKYTRAMFDKQNETVV